MSVDISNLLAVPMKKRNGVSQGTRYFLDSVLIARTCSWCSEIKYVDEFHKDSSKLYGIESTCKDCRLPYLRSIHVPKPPRPKAEPKPRSKEQNRVYREVQNKRLTSRTEADILADQQRLRPDGIKQCGSCSTKYPVSNFHSSIYSADGLFRYCKPCHHRKNLERIRKEHIEYWIGQGIPIECYVCGGPYEESEHIIPLTLGGPDVLSNMLPSCVECNRGVGGKHASPLKEWLFSKFTEDLAKTILDKVISYGIDPG